MGFSIDRAMGAAAQGVADVAKNYATTEINKRATLDLDAERAKALADRDARLHDQSVSFERDVRQPFQRSERVAGQEFAGGENAENRRHASQLQKTSLEAAAEQSAQNRQVQREGQAIQSRQVGILAEGAALDREIKQIQINNAKDLERLRVDFQAEQDPDRRARISENIRVLTGKANENYLPVPLKNADGDITGYQIFDKQRGTWVNPSKGRGKGGDNDPLGIRDRLSKPGDKGGNPLPKSVGLIDSAMAADAGIPGAAPLNPEAQQSFDRDVKAMEPRDLVERYKGVVQSLSAQQQSQYYEAQKKLPPRVPFIDR